MKHHPHSIPIHYKRAFPKFLLGFSMLLLLAMLTNVTPVSAVAGITVNTTVDEDGTGTDCSLREAITSANTNTDYGGCTGAIGSPFFIIVPAGTYTLDTAKAASSDDALQIGPDGSINVTITGEGSGTTTITTDAATCTTGTVRVLNLDPNLNGNVVVEISGVTISNGIANTYGGGAILGGGTGNSLTLSDSIIADNCTAGVNSAAGISWSPDGDMTITNTTFSNNLSGEAAGALLFDSSGTLDVSGSTFSDNTAGATGSAGGALFLGTGTFNINGNTFTNNQATDVAGIGGALYLGSGTLNLGTTAANVFVGNTAGISTSSGLGVRGGTATAENNWWGCNDGPASGVGCDLADNVGGTLDFDPWLVLSNTASPTSVTQGNDSTLTADFLHNSDNDPLTALFVAALVGRTVTWSNAQLGSLSNEQTTIQAAGTATATFTGTSCGAGGADAAVDNSGAITASVTVTTCGGGAQTGPNFVVNTADDHDDTVCSTTDCTLREAINAANALAGTDSITFQIPNMTGCTGVNVCTITLGSSLPNLTDDLTIDGAPNNGDITVSGNDSVRILQLINNITLNLNALTIADGFATASGAGLYVNGGATLNVSNSTFSGNSISTSILMSGGAAIINVGGTVRVTNSTFDDNSFTVPVNCGPCGGTAILNLSGTLEVTNSTFSGNTFTSPGTCNPSCGGAIRSNGGTTSVTNSTFSGNLVSGNGHAGALSVESGTVTLRNSIISGSTPVDCFVGGGTLTADAFNIDSDGSCGSATTKTTVEIALGALAENGGPTQTMALGNASAAINAGDNTVCAAAVGSPNYGAGGLDQRGTVRPQGLFCDVGAFELVYTGFQSEPNLVVNSAADTNDNSCDTLGQGIGNQDCTLREAISAANALAGTDSITFQIPNMTGCTAANVCTITLGSALPAINDHVTIDGTQNSADITVDGDNLYRVFYINSGKTVTLDTLTITRGITPNKGNGGGIYNAGDLTVANSTVTDNRSTGAGAGIYNNGTLQVTNSTISDNRVDTSFNGDTIGGGGIFNNGTMDITDSTFSGNYGEATVGGGGGAIANGGTGTNNIIGSTFTGNSPSFGSAIYHFESTLNISNSTFTGNTGGGALGVSASAILIVKNSTIANNSASFASGVYVAGGANVSLSNTIISGNSNGNCHVSSGTLTADLYNIDSDGTCGSATTKTTTEIALGALANNGGPTETMALGNSSVAIDAGDNNVCDDNPSPNNLDQRGKDRDDLNCDVGAFEFVLSDGDAIAKSNLSSGPFYTFGPTLAGVTAGSFFSPTLTIGRELTPPTAGTPPANPLPIKWDVGVSGGTYNFIFTLCYDPSVLSGQNENTLHVWHYNGSTWDDLGGTLDDTTHLPYHCVTAVTPLSALSPLAIAPGATTAVNVTGPNARVNPKGKIVVKWRTTNESQIAGFNIYRKNGKGEWKQINKNFKQAKQSGDAAGNQYRFTNRDVKPGKTYRYKIQILYLDNHTEWTNVVKIKTP